MRVLTITGDTSFKPGSLRYDLQRGAADVFEVVYWGWGNMWPPIPREQFDVVTVQDPFWRGLFAWLMARRRGAKFNVQVHTDLAAQSFVRHVLAQMVLRHADSVRVVSEKIKRQVLRWGVRTPVHVLPIFVNTERLRGLEHRPHQQKTILWIGRFEPEKDPGYALEVLRRIRAQGVDAKLVMLGSGSLLPPVTAAARGLPVELPGWQDPRDYFPLADVVLSTSLHESYGASSIEALAAGVAVVAPPVGVLKESGAIVSPREELAGGVLKVLQSGVRGALTLSLLTKEEWARAWQKSLI